jgi:Cof subfamily protein (haloacid dehalogenase superfamily)
LADPVTRGKIQLLATDLDGTVFSHGDAAGPRVLAALGAAVAAGVRVIIATGRTPRSVELFRTRWQLPAGPMICYNGAEVVDLPVGTQWLSLRLTAEAARRTMDLAMAGDYLTQVYLEDRLWASRDDDRVRRYVESNHIPAEIKPGASILAWPSPPIKILIQDEPDRLHALRAAIEPWAASLDARALYSQADYLEVLPAAASKGAALRRVVGRLGIPREAVAAVGDGENDADMLAWAGLGMAMGGGHPAAIAAADVVLPPVTEDGVVEGIHRYVL